MTECEQFFGRLLDLCEGRGVDGRPHPPRHAVEQFRAHYGLPPLTAYPDPDEPPSDSGTEQNLFPTTGPGAKLEEIFVQIGVPYYEDCGCRAYARQMDGWGIQGCRERFDEIVTRLRVTADKYSMLQRFEAVIRAASTGLAFRLNPFDPFPSLLEEALRRAEQDV